MKTFTYIIYDIVWNRLRYPLSKLNNKQMSDSISNKCWITMHVYKHKNPSLIKQLKSDLYDIT